jgi:TfoX/Sxy family transcriptional regulator of competence genes
VAYDPELAIRLEKLFARRRGLSQKAMFGGLGWLLHGNMCAGIWKDSLIARVGPEDYDAAVREPGVREFDITGRPMTGWVMVGPESIETDVDLQGWVERSLRFVRTLPKKSG